MSLCVALYIWAPVPAIIFPETGAKCNGGQPILGTGNWSLKANSLFYTFYVWTRMIIFLKRYNYHRKISQYCMFIFLYLCNQTMVFLWPKADGSKKPENVWLVCIVNFVLKRLWDVYIFHFNRAVSFFLQVFLSFSMKGTFTANW